MARRANYWCAGRQRPSSSDSRNPAGNLKPPDERGAAEAHPNFLLDIMFIIGVYYPLFQTRPDRSARPNSLSES